MNRTHRIVLGIPKARNTCHILLLCPGTLWGQCTMLKSTAGHKVAECHQQGRSSPNFTLEQIRASRWLMSDTQEDKWNNPVNISPKPKLVTNILQMPFFCLNAQLLFQTLKWAPHRSSPTKRNLKVTMNLFQHIWLLLFTWIPIFKHIK